MGEDRDWQKELISAALMAASKTAMQYITNPGSRDEAIDDVKSRLAEVDYGAAAKAVSDVIDRVADSAKQALNEAIDTIRENAEDAVGLAAEKAQSQLGVTRKRGKGRMLFGIVLGIALGFILLNEDRRNQIMDKMTGATGPINGSQWSTVASGSKPAATTFVDEPVEAAEPAEPPPTPEAEDSPPADTGNGTEAKATTRKAKASGSTKSDA